MHPSLLLSVKEIRQRDIAAIVQYWLGADPAFLTGMGVDLVKMPDRESWTEMLSAQLDQPMEKKQSYCIIWEAGGQAIGHSNVNKIVFGEAAFMHLHLWKPDIRQKGMGAALVKMTLPYFFENLELQQLYCEPYALNPAPNKTLEKVGFEFVKTYTTTPGWINFEQPVNLWSMSRDRFLSLF